MLSPALWQDVKKFAAFGVVGGINGVVDYAVFTLLIFIFFKNESTTSVIIANCGAWAVAVTSSYIMNALFTFRAESGGKLALNKYLAFAAAGFLGLLTNTVAVLGFQLLFPLLIAKFLAFGVAAIVNFSVTKFFVFKKS